MSLKNVIFSTNMDPASVGVEAPVGSILIAQDGTTAVAWVKVDAADTDWVQIGSSGGATVVQRLTYTATGGETSATINLTDEIADNDYDVYGSLQTVAAAVSLEFPSASHTTLSFGVTFGAALTAGDTFTFLVIK